MPARNLIYTVAMDRPGSSGHRALAKMLVSSLLKTYFTGDILVFRNTEAPLFLVARKGVREIFIDTSEPAAGWDYLATRWKYKVATQIDHALYDRIMFLDADCLALRNIDHLLEGDWDIACMPERGLSIIHPQFNCFLAEDEMTTLKSTDGINSGTLAIRGQFFHQVMQQWACIDASKPLRGGGFSDQPAWNRLVLDTGLQTFRFSVDEVQFPMYQHPRFPSYHKAALTHNLGGTLSEKVHFTFGLYMQNFYCDPTALFLQFLDI